MLEQPSACPQLAAFTGSNSNEARLQALERRLAGLPSPSTSSLDGHPSSQVCRPAKAGCSATRAGAHHLTCRPFTRGELNLPIRTRQAQLILQGTRAALLEVPCLRATSQFNLLKASCLSQDAPHGSLPGRTSPAGSTSPVLKSTSKILPATGTSPAPKAAGQHTYESEEDDGSRDAFSLPAHTALAAPIGARASTPHAGGQKRKEAPGNRDSKPQQGSESGFKSVLLLQVLPCIDFDPR